MKTCKFKYGTSVILEVTADEYELPVAVFESVKECAEHYNTTPNIISHAMCCQKKGLLKATRRGTKFVRVFFDEVEDEVLDKKEQCYFGSNC